MKTIAWLIFGCLLQVSACAAEIDHDPAPMPERPAVVGHFFVHRLVKGVSQQAIQTLPPRGESALSLAMGRAANKGIIERGVDEYTEILIQCQKAKSVVLTSPFLRSDSQQAHCYRF